jgi:hypothetical protein
MRGSRFCVSGERLHGSRHGGKVVPRTSGYEGDFVFDGRWFLLSRRGAISSTETADGCYEQSRGDAKRDSGSQTRKQSAPTDRKARDTYRQSSHHSGNVDKGRGHFCYLWASVDRPIFIQTRPMPNIASCKKETANRGGLLGSTKPWC